jgi:hypothetical protein
VTSVTREAAHVEAKVREFGNGARANPVRAEVARLRARRDAGELGEREWAVKVAELLGAVDPTPLAAHPSLVG